jgi:hypothetical protein
MEIVLTVSYLFIFSILVASSSLNILFPALSQEQTSMQKKEVTITIMLDDQGDPPRLLRMLFEPALQEQDFLYLLQVTKAQLYLEDGC